MTCNLWHMTCDTWRVVNILLTFQVPSFNSLGVAVFEDIFTSDESLTLLMTRVCLDQTSATPGLLHILLLGTPTVQCS